MRKIASHFPYHRSVRPGRPEARKPVVPPRVDAYHARQVTGGRHLVDTVIKKTAWIGYIQLLGIAAGLIERGGTTVGLAKKIASSLFHGDMIHFSQTTDKLSKMAMHPPGFAGWMLKSSIGWGAAGGTA